MNCLGNNPKEIEVIINEIKLKDLELGCDYGQVIETLQSLSLQDDEPYSAIATARNATRSIFPRTKRKV
jgi:hypothetical protein